MGFISDIFGGGDDAGDAAIQASNTQANYQQQALNYLKNKERLPNKYRNKALRQLNEAYSGNQKSQNKIIKQSMNSPLYQAIMGGQEAGEEAILRNAAATGGLRSGNVQSNLYDYNTQLQNQALLTAYNDKISGLQGLASIPSLATEISSQTGQIGSTYAQGQIAAAQANQSGQQNQFGNLLGLGGLGLQAYQSGMFSDRRLKKNIKLIGNHKGFNLYSWDWNIVAQKMGLIGKTVGCLADEVYVKRPDAVSIKDLFMFVHYDKIGILV